MYDTKDSELKLILENALSKMKAKNYNIQSRIEIQVDQKLNIMGYTKKVGNKQVIVVSGWSLETGMIEGLVLHELAHIYFIEKGYRSHKASLLGKILEKIKATEGLRSKEVEYLIEAYNHYQNILVDDIVFDVIDEEMKKEIKQFFRQWVSEKPTGDPVSDAAVICRNAFAIASLRRRGLIDDKDPIIQANKRLIEKSGKSKKDFEWIEAFLENARPDYDDEEHTRRIQEYFEVVINTMRSTPWIEDLR